MEDNDTLLKETLKRGRFLNNPQGKDWDDVVASLEEDLGGFAAFIRAILMIALVLAVGFGVLLALVWAVRLAIRITA